MFDDNIDGKQFIGVVELSLAAYAEINNSVAATVQLYSPKVIFDVHGICFSSDLYFLFLTFIFY